VLVGHVRGLIDGIKLSCADYYLLLHQQHVPMHLGGGCKPVTCFPDTSLVPVHFQAFDYAARMGAHIVSASVGSSSYRVGG
jgi:hypothetical protein